VDKPKFFETADGNQEKSIMGYISINTKLTPDADKKAIQFWVTETIPPRDYALLGHKDLADFVIELGSNPKLIWKNTIQENKTPRSNLNSRFDSCG
jgi:hypothetical protein